MDELQKLVLKNWKKPEFLKETPIRIPKKYIRISVKQFQLKLYILKNQIPGKNLRRNL